MDFNINKIYHNYITKMVVFSIFLYKRNFRQPNVYKTLVLNFLKKRIPWDIDLDIDTGERLEKIDERELFLIQILEDIEIDYLNNVIVTFRTPIKKITIDIDLTKEEKYMKYVFS
jgi:hypothetical protein